MKVILKLEDFIFKSKNSHFVMVLFLLLIFKVGIWFMPNLGSSRAVSQNPFSNPFHGTDMYIFWNWLGPFLTWALGIQSWLLFFLFHLICSFLFILVFIRLAFKSFPNTLARKTLIIFLSLPVAGTSFYWVGMDSLTLLLMILPFLFPRKVLFAVLMGILLGMQHFEQGVFAYSGLFFAVLLSEKLGYRVKYSSRFCIALLIGVIGGKFLLYSLFHFYSIDIRLDRRAWFLENLPRLIQQFGFHFQIVLWSTLGLGWLVALRFMDWGKSALPFFIFLVALLMLLPIVEDQTRVIAIITFPLVLVFWLLNQNFIEKLSQRETSFFLLLWIVLPWTWVWGGITRVSALPFDVVCALNLVLGWFELPARLADWPFF